MQKEGLGRFQETPSLHSAYRISQNHLPDQWRTLFSQKEVTLNIDGFAIDMYWFFRRKMNLCYRWVLFFAVFSLSFSCSSLVLPSSFPIWIYSSSLVFPYENMAFISLVPLSFLTWIWVMFFSFFLVLPKCIWLLFFCSILVFPYMNMAFDSLTMNMGNVLQFFLCLSLMNMAFFPLSFPIWTRPER